MEVDARSMKAVPRLQFQFLCQSWMAPVELQSAMNGDVH